MPAAALKIEPETSAYAVEPLSLCRGGIGALMERHGTEFTYYKDRKGPVTPDWAFYDMLERQGRLRVCTARANGVLVGYFVIVTDISKHYRVRLALDDTFYLLPQYRMGWGLYKFMKFCVAQMKAMVGSDACLVVADKFDQDLGPIWKRLGFRPEEVRWTQMTEHA